MSIFRSRFPREHVDALSRDSQSINSSSCKTPPQDMQIKVQRKLDDPSFFGLKEAPINSEDIAQFDQKTLQLLKYTIF